MVIFKLGTKVHRGDMHVTDIRTILVHICESQVILLVSMTDRWADTESHLIVCPFPCDDIERSN